MRFPMPSSSSTTAARRSNANATEKKLRKRRELDARLINSSRTTLLLSDDDEDGVEDEEKEAGGDEEEDLEMSVAKKMIRSNKKSSRVSFLIRRVCGGLWWLSVGVSLCFVVVFAILVLHVQMKSQIIAFRNELEQGEELLKASTTSYVARTCLLHRV